jgi:hypothetical protein
MFKESRMGITLFTFGGMFAPLQGLMGWFASRPHSASVQPVRPRPAAAPVACVRPAASRRPHRPLRVVRVMDAPASRAGAGRMFISGRMADVCAELDRLAALEAAAQ